jgi:hypothetical protein
MNWAVLAPAAGCRREDRLSVGRSTVCVTEKRISESKALEVSNIKTFSVVSSKGALSRPEQYSDREVRDRALSFA